jgi:mevalonate pyrophosphate decarboxylase
MDRILAFIIISALKIWKNNSPEKPENSYFDNIFEKRRKKDGRNMNAETVKRKNRFPAPALSGSGSKGLSQAVSMSGNPHP